MAATSANPRNNGAVRARLPLTPKVTAYRRGAHGATRRGPIEGLELDRVAPAGRPMVSSPSLVRAARGVRLEPRPRAASKPAQPRAINLRDLRI